MEKRSENNQIKPLPKIIVITGAESTGKSTLTEELANHFNVPFLPEIARNYIENLNRKYTYNDIEKIARLQVEQLKQYKNSEHRFIFLDTWLIVTKIWFEVVFSKGPAWLTSEIQNSKIDFFLVCNTDLPWIPDPVRENGGQMRNILQNRYIETITNYEFKYKVISGQKSDRLKNAIQCLDKLQ